MAKYTVKLMQRASSDLDDIYNRIADDFKETGTAEKMADSLEKWSLSLLSGILRVVFDIM